MRKVWIILPAVFLLGSVVFNVVSFASTGTVGGDLYALTQKTQQMQEENRKLSVQLASQKSLHSLLEKASGEGYIFVTNLVQVAPKDTQVALDIHRR